MKTSSRIDRAALRVLTWSLPLAGAVSASAQEAGAAAPATPPAPEKKSAWEKSAALGMTMTRGNSDTLLITGNFLASRKENNNEFSFGGDGTYGEADSEKNSQSVHGFGQYNRLFTERFYGYARIDGLHDEIADLDYRFTFSPGVGYYFIKNDRTRLSGEVGPGFIYEKQGGETTGYMTARLAERFEHKVNERVRIWQSLEFLPQVDDLDNFILNAEAGVESSLTKKWSLRTFVQNTYDNEPAPDREKNDLKWVTAIAYKF